MATVDVFQLHPNDSEIDINVCFDWIRSCLRANQQVTIYVRKQSKIEKKEIPKEIAKPSTPTIDHQAQLNNKLETAKKTTNNTAKLTLLKEAIQYYEDNQINNLELLVEIYIEINEIETSQEYQEKVIELLSKDINLKNQFEETFKKYIREKIKKLIGSGNLETANQNFKKALDEYKKAIDLVEQVQEDKETMIQIHVYLGNTHQQLKEPELALQIWEKTIKMINHMSQNLNFQNELIYLHNNIGQIYYDKKQHAKAISYWDGAIDILEKQDASQPLELQAKQLLGHLLNNVGMIYYQKGEVKKAIQNFEKTIQVYENIYGKGHISVGNRMNNLGEAYRSDKQYDKALEMFQKALKIKEKELSNQPNKSLASTINNIGMTLQNKQSYKDAIKEFQSALKMYSEPGVYSDPNSGDGAIQRSNTMHSIAECYRATHDMDSACYYFEQSYQLKLSELKIYHKSTQHTAIQLASAYFQTNQFERSMEIFSSVLDGQKKVYGEESQIVAQTMNNIGTVQSELKQYSKALEYVQEAIRIFEKKLDQSDPYLQKAYENLKTIKQKLEE